MTRLRETSHCGHVPQEGLSIGTAVDFICGTSVRVSLQVDSATKQIQSARFTTSGCGVSIAFCEFLARFLESKSLTDLKGEWAIKAYEDFVSTQNGLESDRALCIATVTEAYSNALKDFRQRQLTEVQTESPLICTCFGVTEERISDLIVRMKAASVAELGELTSAGTGCGSCLMLLTELLETRDLQG